MMKYERACQWIANNDNPGDNEDIDALAGYLTICLVADVFDKDTVAVATRVKEIRDAN